jgi:hypothetical protein
MRKNTSAFLAAMSVIKLKVLEMTLGENEAQKIRLY